MPARTVTWADANAAPRHRPVDLIRRDVPVDPGVYVWYRRGRAIYVGKADSLVERVWGDHLGQRRSIGGSAFRRNVAEHLGFGTPADIKVGRVRLTPEQLAAVRAWIMGCRVAWLTRRSIAAARLAEIQLKTEWTPPLTKR
jgi:hypothetical protein